MESDGNQISSVCEVCKVKAHKKCSRCGVVYYCSTEHQKEHFASHSSVCKRFDKEMKICKMEEEKLKDLEDMGGHRVNCFEDEHYIGEFWSIIETRNYMRARVSLVKTLEEFGTSSSLQLAVNHIFDMLRLCRGDNLGMRDIMPGLLLSLNKFQECYDFIIWWMTFPDGKYDWGDISLPFLHFHNENMNEKINSKCLEKYVDLSHLVALIRIKINSLHEEKNEDQKEILNEQIKELIAFLQTRNKHFIPGMLNYQKTIRTNPSYYSVGDSNEAIQVVKNQYNVFSEPSVLKYFRT